MNRVSQNLKLACLWGGVVLLIGLAGCMSPRNISELQDGEAGKAGSPLAVNVQAQAKPPLRALSPEDPASPIYLGIGGRLAGRGDPSRPASEAYRAGMAERPPALQIAGIAKDKFGLVNWVAMVDAGVIQPKESLDPAAESAPPLELDIVIKPRSDFVKDVVFPHRQHTYWFDCAACHPALFVMGKGQNKMSMKEIGEGKWCGSCHGKVAFPLADCARCHSREKDKAGAPAT